MFMSRDFLIKADTLAIYRDEILWSRFDYHFFKRPATSGVLNEHKL